MILKCEHKKPIIKTEKTLLAKYKYMFIESLNRESTLYSQQKIIYVIVSMHEWFMSIKLKSHISIIYSCPRLDLCVQLDLFWSP